MENLLGEGEDVPHIKCDFMRDLKMDGFWVFLGGGFPGRKPAHGSQPIPEKKYHEYHNTSTKMENYHDILLRKIILFANLISEASLYLA